MDIRVIRIGPKSRLGMAALAAGVVVVGGTLVVLGAALLLALAAAGAVVGTGVVLYRRLTGRGRAQAPDAALDWTRAGRQGLDPRMEVRVPEPGAAGSLPPASPRD